MPTPCDLKLEAFADDGTTVLWDVGTAADHANPYLVLPDRYAEQEIDVASGGASIGTVTVTVIDPAIVPGDQEGGWMTARLAELGVAAIAGRRFRLTRWNGVAWIRVADGPAGTPALDPSYAAYSWEIRDTRETERKARAFENGGSRTLVPEGVLNGYGWDPIGSTWLIDPAIALRGIASNYGAFGGISWYSSPPDHVNSLASRTVSAATIRSLLGDLVSEVITTEGPVVGYEAWGQWTQTVWTWSYGNRVLLRWRLHAGPGAWHYLGPTLQTQSAVVSPPDGDDTSPQPPNYGGGGVGPYLVVAHQAVAGGPYILDAIGLGDSAAVPDLPAGNDDVDVQIISLLPASKDNPVHIEGMTAGEFAQLMYDGVYSPRDDAGNVVSTGIRYEEAALLQMTWPVRLRITAPIDDVRDFLEKYIYGPSGYAPALNADGEISPVSQIPPVDTDSLPAIDDTIAEPSPDWNAGDRIINVVVITYPRDYVPDTGVTPETGDGLSARSVRFEFTDPLSIARHGRQVHELDLSAFRAVGYAATADPIGSIATETAYQIGLEREAALLARYALGAPAFRANIMREESEDLRAGSYVIASLSWLPDYITARRGLLGLAQVMSIGDLDCAWREVLIELVASGGS